MLHALIASFRRDEEGQGLAEYALILALIAIVAIIALIFLGGQVSKILSTVGGSSRYGRPCTESTVGPIDRSNAWPRVFRTGSSLHGTPCRARTRSGERR